MPKNEEKGMPVWFKNILWLIGTAGLIFAGIMRVYLNPINEKIKQIGVSATTQIKRHIDRDSFRFKEVEKDIRDIKNNIKDDRKEINRRLRNLEKGQGIILTRIEQLKNRR